MIINKSSVDLAATHSANSQSEVSETLRAWIGSQRPNFEAMDRSTTASISSTALAALKANPPALAQSTALPAASDQARVIQDAMDAADGDPILSLMRLMVEMLTKHKIGSFAIRMSPGEGSGAAVSSRPSSSQTTPAAQAAPRAGYGVEYDKHVVHSESEQTQLQATGSVVTADGRAIDFKLDVAMSRSYREQSSVSLRQGDGIKKDPLVINFGANAADLQSQRFSFSLDATTNADQVPMLASGSGFLALDINGNGKIDSGKELFGAQSGNGFSELGAYDSDGNGWIDENDPVFKQLRVWTPDAGGGGGLSTLADLNVGALSLARTSTPFEIRDGNNQSLGSVRSTGVFLREDGSAGSVQQIDLTI